MIVCAILETLLPVPLAAQTPDPPTDTTALLIGFSYNYDTYVWSDSVRFIRRLSSKTSWGLDGGLSATQISSSDGLTRKQRFVSGRMFVDHQWSSRWSGGICIAQRRQRLEELANRHFVFSDILTRVKYAISPSVWLTQNTGFSLANRSTGGASTASTGLASETSGRWETRRWWNRLWRAHGSLRVIRLRNIPLVEGQWGVLMSGPFAGGDSVSVLVEDLSRRTRYYPAADDYAAIAEQRLRDGQFKAVAKGAWGDHLRWETTTDIVWRREIYSLIRGPRTTASLLPLGLRQSSRGYRGLVGGHLGPHGGVSVAYRYSEAEEDFGADVKDQNSETGELEVVGFCRPRAQDSLAVRAVWKVISFFVPPDSGFYTDRDLATRGAEFAWRHRHSPAWETTLLFSYRGYRQVYLSGRWSGNNNHNDIYLLEPGLRWSPAPGWQVRQVYRIQADYLSYDVEKGQPQPERSTLYRRGESETRLVLAPFHTSEVEARYTYRYEDFGPLIWREKWNQLVAWDRRSHVTGLAWRYKPAEGWEAVPGISFEEKQAYQHGDENGTNTRRPAGAFVRRVAELAGRWRSRAGRDDLRLSGSRRIQKSPGGRKDISDWVEFTYHRYW